MLPKNAYVLTNLSKLESQIPTERLYSCCSLLSHGIIGRECPLMLVTYSSLPFLSPFSKQGAIHSSQQEVTVEMSEARFRPPEARNLAVGKQLQCLGISEGLQVGENEVNRGEGISWAQQDQSGFPGEWGKKDGAFSEEVESAEAHRSGSPQCTERVDRFSKYLWRTYCVVSPVPGVGDPDVNKTDKPLPAWSFLIQGDGHEQNQS